MGRAARSAGERRDAAQAGSRCGEGDLRKRWTKTWRNPRRCAMSTAPVLAGMVAVRGRWRGAMIAAIGRNRTITIVMAIAAASEAEQGRAYQEQKADPDLRAHALRDAWRREGGCCG